MDFEQERISVIVPVYNVDKYIRRCVDSIINQTYRNLQIILVDDGSQDKSGKICDEYKKVDTRVEVIHKENGGLGFARNSGLDIATGSYVTFIDGDDSIEPSHIKNLYQNMKETGSDTCMGGHTRIYNEKHIPRENVCAGQKYTGNDIKKEILVRMVGAKPDGSDYIEMSACMVLFSLSIIKDNNIRFHSEREYISEDLIFDFDYYSKAQKVTVCDDVGYNYYDNEGSLTTKYNPKRFEMQKKMTQEVVRRAKGLEIYPLCEQRILNTFISISRYCIKLEQLFSKDNGVAQSKAKIKIICNDSLLIESFNRFDKNVVPVKSKIVNWLIIHKKIDALVVVMGMKNKLGV